LLRCVRYRPPTRLFDPAEGFVGLIASGDKEGRDHHGRSPDPLAAVDGNVPPRYERCLQSADKPGKICPRRWDTVIGDRKGVKLDPLSAGQGRFLSEIQFSDLVRGQQGGDDIEIGDSPRTDFIREPVAPSGTRNDSQAARPGAWYPIDWHIALTPPPQKESLLEIVVDLVRRPAAQNLLDPFDRPDVLLLSKLGPGERCPEISEGR
jgi:hypothetical protein